MARDRDRGTNGERRHREAEERERRVSDIVSEYLDRLNAGEAIDPADIAAKHGELASDVLLELEAFIDLGGKCSSSHSRF